MTRKIFYLIGTKLVEKAKKPAKKRQLPWVCVGQDSFQKGCEGCSCLRPYLIKT